MKEVVINSWDEFTWFLKDKAHRQWLFRGQSNYEWKLSSSLQRVFDEAEGLKTIQATNHYKSNCELNLLGSFKSHAHLYLNHLPSPEDDLSWLSLMQHHGAPTRLLDFTYSAYVALYFALESGQDDASIYCLNQSAIRSDQTTITSSDQLEMFADILKLSLNSKNYLMSFSPVFSNSRLLNQQGLFVTTNTLSKNLEQVVLDYKIELGDYVKLRIPASLRYEGLNLLSKMNVTTSHIYPGLDGFCKGMKSEIVLG
ncbi:MAG: hypothetical protein ACJAS1_002626 [Oleiphilaceae bacterium]|jgi:hypothetical protein